MIKRAHKKPMMVEVHVLFEPNRLQQRVLHQAYLCLVPIARRGVQTQERSEEAYLKRSITPTKGVRHE